MNPIHVPAFANEADAQNVPIADDLDPNHKRTYYDPSVANFLSSWKLVYTRVKAALPSVQLLWCANVS